MATLIVARAATNHPSPFVPNILSPFRLAGFSWSALFDTLNARKCHGYDYPAGITQVALPLLVLLVTPGLDLMVATLDSLLPSHIALLTTPAPAFPLAG